MEVHYVEILQHNIKNQKSHICWLTAGDYGCFCHTDIFIVVFWVYAAIWCKVGVQTDGHSVLDTRSTLMQYTTTIAAVDILIMY
jgi:hypothetical protein